MKKKKEAVWGERHTLTFPPGEGGKNRQKLEEEIKAPVCPDTANETGADSTEEEESSNNATEAAKDASVDLTMTDMIVWKVVLLLC